MSEVKDLIESVLTDQWQSTHDIAREAGMEWGWKASNRISEALCRLQRYGLVERRTSPEDGRIVEWRRIA